MTRIIKDGFLKGLLEYNSDTEIPDFYSLWTGVFMIALCLCRKCFIEFLPIIYPNLYVVLVAESALCRKSTAIGIAESLLSDLEKPPRVFAQKGTPVGLIKEFKIGQDGVGKAQGALIADELITLLDRSAYVSGLIGLMTKLYDSHGGSFTYITAERGREVIIEPCLSLLGGTTPEWLKSSVPVEAVGGGFTSRVIFVSSPRSDKYFPWPRPTAAKKKLRKSLISDLNKIRAISGEFAPTVEAKSYYESIYSKFLKSDFTKERTVRGYVGRRHTTLLKISMCTSASKKDDRTITLEDLQIAEGLLKEVEKKLPSILRSISSSEEGEMTRNVFEMIQRAGSLSHSQLMRNVSHKIRSSELDAIVYTLQESGEITLAVNGRKRVYHLRKE